MSRFKGLFEATKQTENKTTEKITDKKKPTTKNKSIPASPPPAKPVKREKGSGKSSNPNYVQSLAYIKRDTLKNVQRLLFDIPELDYSDLVETLLTDWIKKQK